MEAVDLLSSLPAPHPNKYTAFSSVECALCEGKFTFEHTGVASAAIGPERFSPPGAEGRGNARRVLMAGGRRFELCPARKMCVTASGCPPSPGTSIEAHKPCAVLAGCGGKIYRRLLGEIRARTASPCSRTPVPRG